MKRSNATDPSRDGADTHAGGSPGSFSRNVAAATTAVATAPAAATAPAPATAATDATDVEHTGYSRLPPEMSDAQLSHELIINGNFKVDFVTGKLAPLMPATEKARQVFYDMFWHGVEAEVVEGVTDKRVRCALTELRDALNDLLPEGHCWDDDSAVPDLSEILSAPITITTQTFDYGDRKRLFKSITGFLPTLPVSMPPPNALSREQVSSLLVAANGDSSKEANAFVVALRYLLDHVRASRVDAAQSRVNRRWAQRPPGSTCADYVHFVGKLPAELSSADSAESGFPQLKKILLCADGCVWDRYEGSRSPPISDKDKREWFDKIMWNVGVYLVAGHAPTCVRFDPTSLPETLQYDMARLQGLHRDFSHAVAFATLLSIVQVKLDEFQETNTPAVLAAVTHSIIYTHPSIIYKHHGDCATMIAPAKHALRFWSTMNEAQNADIVLALGQKMQLNSEEHIHMHALLRLLLLRAVSAAKADPKADITEASGSLATTLAVMHELGLPRLSLMPLVPSLRKICGRLRRVMVVHELAHGARCRQNILPLLFGMVPPETTFT
jgi:hypothetical protein